MRHVRNNRASLMICILAIIILTTPLLNLVVHASRDKSLLGMGTGLFLFWMALIIATIISNRFHQEAPHRNPSKNGGQSPDQNTGKTVTSHE